MLEDRILVVDVQHHRSGALEPGRDHVDITEISLNHPLDDGLLSGRARARRALSRRARARHALLTPTPDLLLDARLPSQIGQVEHRHHAGGATGPPEGRTHGERQHRGEQHDRGEPGQQTVNNPVAIADRDGSVHLIYCVEYMRTFYVRSADDGLTWSPPVDITGVVDRFRPEWPWRVVATGPCHGIQLRDGRLVVPVWLAKAEGGAHGKAVVATIYSDDKGATWQRGEIAVHNTATTPGVSEASMAELSDGRVMLIARNHAPAHRKIAVFSRDGATGWSRPEFAEALPEPICQASLLSYDDPAAPGKSLLLFSGPESLERADGKAAPGVRRDRQTLAVKLSRDDGSSWVATRKLEPGPSAYSDLAVLPDGTILCFYESGRPGATRPNSKRTDWPYARLTLARFNLAWLEAGR